MADRIVYVGNPPSSLVLERLYRLSEIEQQEATAQAEEKERQMQRRAAEAEAMHEVAEVFCPESVKEYGRRHGLPTWAEFTWMHGFGAGYEHGLVRGRISTDDHVVELNKEIESLRAELERVKKLGDYSHLIHIISHIRQASGVGARPMLEDLPQAVGDEIQRARDHGWNDALETAIAAVTEAFDGDTWAQQQRIRRAIGALKKQDRAS